MDKNADIFFILYFLCYVYVICEHQEEEDDLEEIDPTAIRSRRTRGVKVDYTSAEALAKAGLKPGEDDDE